MNNYSWLQVAYYQANIAKGTTGKNPSVGCVVINNNNIVGVGRTSREGRPHAEENALNMAGKKAKGSTLYVTLEPCNIPENKNSCTQQIIKSGISKVVIGMLDPNKKTFKRGLKLLKEHGIIVEVAKLSLEHFLLHLAHYSCHKINRPMFTLKLATSADNKITYSNGDSKWITSALARDHAHQVRSFHSAILVGANTLRKDNPTLNSRIRGFKTKSTRIVLDTKLSIREDCNLVTSADKHPLIIFTHNRFLKEKKFKKKTNISIFSVRKNKNKFLNLKEIILKIHELGHQEVLVEGGSKVASSFLNLDIIDKIYIYKSSSFIGNKGLDALGKLKLNNNFFLYNQIKLEDNRIEIWLNKKVIEMYNKIKCLQASLQI